MPPPMPRSSQYQYIELWAGGLPPKSGRTPNTSVPLFPAVTGSPTFPGLADLSPRLFASVALAWSDFTGSGRQISATSSAVRPNLRARGGAGHAGQNVSVIPWGMEGSRAAEESQRIRGARAGSASSCWQLCRARHCWLEETVGDGQFMGRLEAHFLAFSSRCPFKSSELSLPV